MCFVRFFTSVRFLVFNPNMTQVATIQPGPNSRAQPNTENWGSGLFSCFEDVSGCELMYFMSVCVYARF